MELFAVLLVAYMVKIAAEDTLHSVKGTPNPRHAARTRRQKTRSRSRTWNAVANYWGDLVEDASQAATERRRRKAEERRTKREEEPQGSDEEDRNTDVQDAEWWDAGTGDWPDPWKTATPVNEPDDEKAENPGPEATPPAAEPNDGNVHHFPNRSNEENEMPASAVDIHGLDQAINYAQSLAKEAEQHATAGNEGYTALLQHHNVSGETLESAHRMQEAFAAAAEAAGQHADYLSRSRVVQLAYDDVPDAGDKEFVTGGR